MLTTNAQRLCTNLLVLFFGILTVVGASAQKGRAQQTAAYFRANCTSCHTIGGGRRTGPDLKGVSERAIEAGKSRQWLIEFIQDPQKKFNMGDPYALQLLQDAGGTKMTKIPGLDAEQAGFLLDLIDAESLKPESEFKGAEISTRPFLKQDWENGLKLFTGKDQFEGGTVMCMSCHRIAGVGGLGGGNLGPDLTRVFEGGQYAGEGRQNLSQWLTSPSTTTMQSLLEERPLNPDEVHELVALMEHSAATSQPRPVGGSMVSFAILGLLSAAFILFVFDFAWKSRLRSVRRSLVDDSKI